VWVRAQCYQGTSRVYVETLKVVEGSVTLTLGPTRSWTGGSADCRADAGHFFVNRKGVAELKVEASTEFHVAAAG
jgi:hypothetical protein